ncbi:hypothetical protein LCGC14_2472140 [marine sediment metagenome]|uniref:Uncharacterized protein n=1 Tax=marine sediment metagenome TaxID=412755 RepID=A0A0F9DM60_9ZZZZ
MDLITFDFNIYGIYSQLAIGLLLFAILGGRILQGKGLFVLLFIALLFIVIDEPDVSSFNTEPLKNIKCQYGGEIKPRSQIADRSLFTPYGPIIICKDHLRHVEKLMRELREIQYWLVPGF